MTLSETLSAPQHAEVRARLGKARLNVVVDISPAGLLAIGGMVSGMLLSTAVIVHVATRHLRPRRDVSPLTPALPPPPPLR